MKQREKIRLGKHTENGFEYSSKLRFDQNLGLEEQVGKFLKERKIKRRLEKELSGLSGTVKKFKNVERKSNLAYYSALGKRLQFLDKSPFDEVKKYSAFRLIYELLPGILPHISDAKVGSKHIAMMFYIDKIDRKDLLKATWPQWYEIAKFPKLFTDEKLLKKVLVLLRNRKISGPQLRSLIQKSLAGESQE